MSKNSRRTPAQRTRARRIEKAMSKNTYTVEAVKRIYLRATIEARSLEEAQRIADNELILDDYEEIATDYTQTFIG